VRDSSSSSMLLISQTTSVQRSLFRSTVCITTRSRSCYLRASTCVSQSQCSCHRPECLKDVWLFGKFVPLSVAPCSYCMDQCFYQSIPYLLQKQVRPRSTLDVVKVVKIARKYRVPITPYSGATSLEGQFSGVGVML
jgi:hypothetical protein